MKSINMILMKAKFKHYKNIKREREQEQDLDLNNPAPKCMANASFYRPKFRTIDLMTNCWVGDQLLTWWQSLSSCLNKTVLLTSEFKQTWIMKVLGNCLSFSRKKKLRSFGLLELKIWAKHWTVSRLQDRFGLLRCCYNLDLKMAFLYLGLLMKVLGLCLSFPSI